MATDVTDAFLKGYNFPAGELCTDCFKPPSPYIPTSACDVAFRAGIRGPWDFFFRDEIKSVTMSRGLSVRVRFTNGDPDIIYKVDYDRKTVERI